MQIGIIGLGNLGTAVAFLAANNGHNVIGWEYDKAVIADVARHRNERYLAGITLPNTIVASADIDAVFQHADIVFITLPSRYFRGVLSDFAVRADRSIPIVNMAKGIDSVSGKTAFQVLEELFPYNPKAMLAGPSLANEFVHGVLTAVDVATNDLKVFNLVRQALSNDRFSVSYSDDILGVEWGGILKNIYAVGLGLFAENKEQKNVTALNFIGAYLTQALQEIQCYGLVMGAKSDSFMGLSGLGDLIATAVSVQSHNYTMGKLIASGLSIKEVEKKMRSLPEGFNTLKIAVKIAEKQNIAMPLANLILSLINTEISKEEFLTQFTHNLQRNSDE